MSYEREDQVLFEWFRDLLNDEIVDKEKVGERADENVIEILWQSLSREQCTKKKMRRIGIPDSKERTVYKWPYTHLKLLNINRQIDDSYGVDQKIVDKHQQKMRKFEKIVQKGGEFTANTDNMSEDL